MYTKNTKIAIKVAGNGAELLEYSLPHPSSYTRYNKDIYTIEYIVNGTFLTKDSLDYLNDILARFTLSMSIISIETKTIQSEKAIDLALFQGLKSITKHKNYEAIDRGLDNIFYAIKYYTEDLIREAGESNLIAYSLLESYAINNFLDTAKDKSTLKAKCRSIFNWYDERGWTIPARKGKGMTKQEAARYSASKNAENKKAKIVGAVASLQFLNKKINVSSVAKESNTSRDTARKYLKELNYIT